MLLASQLSVMSVLGMKFIRQVLGFFYRRDKPGLTALSEEQYDKELRKNLSREAAERAFEKAWEIRNFEIELYWKRATYFWAFIASTFFGYFALVNSEKYARPDQFDHVDVYFVICIGFVLSVAWVLTNRGSKAWQRHWEVHIDLLEDQFTGPLYKTVHPISTYSVSKINEIVSITFALVWFGLGVKFLFEQKLVNWHFGNLNPFVWLATLSVVGLTMAMMFGYGRGRFGRRDVVMWRRSVRYARLDDCSE